MCTQSRSFSFSCLPDSSVNLSSLSRAHVASALFSVPYCVRHASNQLGNAYFQVLLKGNSSPHRRLLHFASNSDSIHERDNPLGSECGRSHQLSICWPLTVIAADISHTIYPSPCALQTLARQNSSLAVCVAPNTART